MYTVIGYPRTRTFRVLWMLEEAGQPYDFTAAPPQSGAVRAESDLGKVPVLMVDGAAILDSTAILTFLADRHGVLTHPPGTLERARQDAVTQFLLDEFDAALWTTTRHSFILPEDRRIPAIKDSLRWEFGRTRAALIARIGAGPYLMGDKFTLPDIIAGHCLTWAKVAKFDTDDPALEAYLDRLRARPAFQAALARSEAVLSSDAG